MKMAGSNPGRFCSRRVNARAFRARRSKRSFGFGSIFGSSLHLLRVVEEALRFAAATMDEIAAGARVAKGAVYHHFLTKEALFEAVFEQVSLELVPDLDRIWRAEKDPLAAMAAGTQAYCAACAKGATGQIILRNGPAVLGWERWRGIDAKHFGGKFLRAHRGDGGRPDRTPAGPAPGAVAAWRCDRGSRCLLVRSGHRQNRRRLRTRVPLAAGCAGGEVDLGLLCAGRACPGEA